MVETAEPGSWPFWMSSLLPASEASCERRWPTVTHKLGAAYISVWVFVSLRVSGLLLALWEEEGEGGETPVKWESGPTCLLILGLQPHNPELRQFSQQYTPWLGCFFDFLFGQCYLPPDLRQQRGCFPHCVPCGPFSVALRILVGLLCPLLPHPSYLCSRMFVAFGSPALSGDSGQEDCWGPFPALHSVISIITLTGLSIGRMMHWPLWPCPELHLWALGFFYT